MDWVNKESALLFIIRAKKQCAASFPPRRIPCTAYHWGSLIVF